MSSLLAQAIRMEHPETIPVSVGMLPAAWIKYGSELQRLTDQYPQFFHGVKKDLSTIEDSLPASYRKGVYIDEWNCEWHNEHSGMEAYVVGHPIKSEEDVFNLKIPSCRDGRLPHGFMYLRLLDLCGFENAMVWFAQEDEVIETLIDKVLEYNLYQVAAILPRMDEIIYFGDDLGMQRGLAIGAERWRKYLKPCFRKLFGIVKAYKPDQLIYLHTDGCIWEIMPDIMECSVDVINPQFRANGLDNLVRVCRKDQIIPISLDLDRQMFPMATRSQLYDHVASAVESLYLPQGALALNVELNYEVPLDNMAAILDAVEKYRHYKG
ncbi:MAG: uroporphyrinogen decarboxylase family protein [Clostridiales bacterium]|nr:uroporphyrinogen decarboxylase family protein [Clostridiales bacterium]